MLSQVAMPSSMSHSQGALQGSSVLTYYLPAKVNLEEVGDVSDPNSKYEARWAELVFGSQVHMCRCYCRVRIHGIPSKAPLL